MVLWFGALYGTVKLAAYFTMLKNQKNHHEHHGDGPSLLGIAIGSIVMVSATAIAASMMSLT